MESGSRHPIGLGVLVAIAIAALIVLGSVIYWLADGGGTPDNFRQRMSDTGLNVNWSNSDPRGSDGLVDTSYGPVDVAVDLIDDELWIRWADNREVATQATIEALLSCSG